MADNINKNDHVNNPTPNEKGSHAGVTPNFPGSSQNVEQSSLAQGGLMAPHRPPSEADDIAAEQVDHGAEASRSPEHEAKAAKSHKKTPRYSGNSAVNKSKK